LGDTIEEIAAEKAAIIHEQSRVFASPQRPEAEKVIRARCKQMNVEPQFVSGKLEPALNLKILGQHQIANAALAKAVAGLLSESAFWLTEENIAAGLAGASHPGRLEYLNAILFDGAHKPAGAKALRAYLDEIERPITLIFGAMEDKNVAE